MWLHPLSAESVEENLKDAGCSDAFIQSFLAHYSTSTPSQQIQWLHGQRQKLLEQLHDSQKHLDRLDYLCYQIRKHAEVKDS